MKSKFLISCLAGILVLIYSSSSAQEKAANDSAIIMLKQFYTSYITEVAGSGDDKKLALIKKQYCTNKILDRIQKDNELEYDPFLHAQDADAGWLKTLTINGEAKKENVYIVSYLDNYSKKRIINKLRVIKVGRNYKIDDMLNY